MMMPATKKLAYIGACVWIVLLPLGNPSLEPVAEVACGIGAGSAAGVASLGADHERLGCFESCGIGPYSTLTSPLHKVPASSSTAVALVPATPASAKARVLLISSLHRTIRFSRRYIFSRLESVVSAVMG